MHGKAQVAKPIVAEGILLAAGNENAVAAEADVVVLHDCARGVPDLHAVAPLVHSEILPPADLVAAHQGSRGALQVNADQVVFQAVALDSRIRRPLGDEDAAVLGLQLQARSGDAEALDHDAGRIDDNHPALARPHDTGPGRTDQTERLIDCQAPGVVPGGKMKPVAGRGGGDGASEIVPPRIDRPIRRRRRPRQGEANEAPQGEPQQSGPPVALRSGKPRGHYADLGSTSIRPRISMWSAWQNHWQ